MRETLQAWEQAVYDRDAEFLDRFGGGFELVNVSWYSEGMYFTYILDDGHHLHGRIDMDTWLGFYNET